MKISAQKGEAEAIIAGAKDRKDELRAYLAVFTSSIANGKHVGELDILSALSA